MLYEMAQYQLLSELCHSEWSNDRSISMTGITYPEFFALFAYIALRRYGDHALGERA